MSQKKLSIKWRNGRSVDIDLFNNPVSDYYYGCVKHLQNIDLEFNLRKNCLHPDKHNLEQVLTELVQVGSKVCVDIDTDKLPAQSYLNQLHDLYFSSTDGTGCDNANWLRFHDLVHAVEQARDNDNQGSIWFDYEHLAGLLIQPFDRTWLEHSVTEISCGTCFIESRELGKTVIKYIMDGEPYDTAHMCQIMKPWNDIKPVLNVAVTDIDRRTKLSIFKQEYQSQLDDWVKNFQNTWTQHWNLTDWNIDQEMAALPVGFINDIDTVIACFRNEDYPHRITY